MARLPILATLLALTAILASGCKKDDPRRHYEREGGFSYIPPEGWERLPPTKGSDKVTSYGEFVGKADPLGPAFIRVFEEAHPGTLDIYVQDILRNSVIGQGFDVKKSSFTTDAGVQGIRLTAAAPGIHLTIFAFDHRLSKLQFLCKPPIGKENEYTLIFESCLKTFRFD